MKPPRFSAKPNRRTLGKSEGERDVNRGRPPRVRTYHRTEQQAPTEGFDQTPEAGVDSETPSDSPPKFRGMGTVRRRPPLRVGSGQMPAGLAAASGHDSAELHLRVPPVMMQKLEARARLAGVEVNALLRVWISEKLLV